MVALLIQTSTSLPSWWFVLACLAAMALIPLTEYAARTAARRRLASMLALAVFLAVALTAANASASVWDFPEWCCPAMTEYWLCWPIGWPGC